MDTHLISKAVAIAGATILGSFVGAVWGLTLAAIPGWLGAPPLPDPLCWITAGVCTLLLASFASVAADSALSADFYDAD